MLVLSRRVGEKLLIGDDIEITIIDARGDGVRIGIDAPRSMKIHRAEVVEAVKESNSTANVSDDAAAAAASEALRNLVGSLNPQDPQQSED